MKKVLFLVPHLSTGGMPQYTYDLMRKIKDDVDVYCVEYSFIAADFVVQRNRIINLLGDKFFALGDDKKELFEIINNIQPDIIHLQEIPEYFLNPEIASRLYSKNRLYKIIETSHDSSFSCNHKTFLPDHLALISEYQKNEFSKLRIPIDLVEADIEYKERQDRTTGLLNLGLDPNLKHVLNVGLFTPRKNQAEAIEYAKLLEEHPIQFHFVGNLADNFKSYWEPIIQNLPSNVKIWGERSDVENFYSCMDLMLFTSRGNGQDRETSPLVIREAIGYNLPSLIFNLDVYLGMYDKYQNITYLDFHNLGYNLDIIKQKLKLIEEQKEEKFFETPSGKINFERLKFPQNMYESMLMYGESAPMWWGTFIHKELDRGGIRVEEGDVFVDLGANIGISSYYASKAGAGKIYCFEPDRHVLSMLEKNLTKHHVSFNYAISDTKTVLELYNWPHNDSNVGPKYKIESVTLDEVYQLVGEPVIDYLKIDIEGFEENLFDRVSRNTIGHIKKMFIEYHWDDKTSLFVEKLEKLGFDVNVEYGYGQNYIYCVNNRLKSYNREFANVSYDKQSNKVNYSFHEDSKNITVSVKDIDSHAVIWSSSSEFVYANTFYWIMPTPKNHLDFETHPNFGGFIVDFYQGEDLIYSKSFRIKKPAVSKQMMKITNRTEPNFFNYNEFFVDKIYDSFLKDKKFETVVDLGANVGLWSEYIRSVADVHSIYMVEPNKKAVKILQETYINDDKSFIVPKAVSNFDGETDLFTSDDNSLVSSIIEEHRSISDFGTLSNSEKIQVCKLSTLILENQISKIDLLKIDIEGAEYDLFCDMSSSEFEKIENILLEYHFVKSKSMDDINSILKILESNGFESYLNELSSTGGFIFASKGGIHKTKIQKNVKVVQFLLNGDYDKQNQSIKNLSKLEDFGIHYVKHFNDKYTDLPPIETCNRPHDVGIDLKPNALTPAHYGCYNSFKKAFLSEFDDDLDFLIIMEGDAKIQNHQLFVDKLNESIELIEKNNIGFLSFGGIFDLEFGVLQSNLVENLSDDFFVCDKIIGCQCIIFPSSSRESMRNILENEKWDALDIYLNQISHNNNIRIGVSRKTLVTQFDGISSIDNVVKQFKEFSL